MVNKIKPWMARAIEEGHVCPKCKRPIAPKQWAAMKPGQKCWICRYADFDSDGKKVGAGGSSVRDNQDRDAFSYEREKK